ncbi:DUF2290 domain-containing protein [Ideonella sp. B508-1]|uniref:DUF2290 domain-containing protein n=1 Tax=Ideonella sp. B508-1 TaxID=137716 RepID=UPI000A011404|nr:DUF2290 domain-containing protein [Ideonella sp. B508-1]
MSQAVVASQLREMYSRMLIAGLSVKQTFPSERRLAEGKVSVGDLPLSSLALKNIPYRTIYSELDGNDAYHMKMPDGGLLIFQYRFDAEGKIENHRLGFFPSPELPTVEEAPYLYEKDELFGDIVLERIVRFPIRFDYDPDNHTDMLHPKSHVTFGQFENCRIPVSTMLFPYAFLLFILRNFYHRCYIKNKNTFDKSIKSLRLGSCITDREQGILHLAIR